MKVRDLMNKYVSMPAYTKFTFYNGRDLNESCSFWYDEMGNMSEELLDSYIYRFGISVNTGASVASDGHIEPVVIFMCSLFDYPKRLKMDERRTSIMEQLPSVERCVDTDPIPKKHTPITCDTSSSDIPCDTCTPSIVSIVNV